MTTLLQGIHHVQAHVFSPQREFFERLAEGQKPDALFVTCSDSRVSPRRQAARAIPPNDSEAH